MGKTKEGISGQLSLFDCVPDHVAYKYRFRRYVGRKVRMMFGAYPGEIRIGRIKEIPDHYYTIVDIDGREYAATPYNLGEVDCERDL